MAVARLDSTQQQFSYLWIIHTSSDKLVSRQNAVTVRVQLPHNLDHLAEVDVR